MSVVSPYSFGLYFSVSILQHGDRALISRNFFLCVAPAPISGRETSPSCKTAENWPIVLLTRTQFVYNLLGNTRNTPAYCNRYFCQVEIIMGHLMVSEVTVCPCLSVIEFNSFQYGFDGVIHTNFHPEIVLQKNVFVGQSNIVQGPSLVQG
jgi:hypothetical protein